MIYRLMRWLHAQEYKRRCLHDPDHWERSTKAVIEKAKGITMEREEGFMSAERMMTLDEWVNRLPEIHIAHIEYVDMKQENEKLKAEIVQSKEETVMACRDAVNALKANQALRELVKESISLLELNIKAHQNNGYNCGFERDEEWLEKAKEVLSE